MGEEYRKCGEAARRARSSGVGAGHPRASASEQPYQPRSGDLAKPMHTYAETRSQFSISPTAILSRQQFSGEDRRPDDAKYGDRNDCTPISDRWTSLYGSCRPGNAAPGSYAVDAPALDFVICKAESSN